MDLYLDFDHNSRRRRRGADVEEEIVPEFHLSLESSFY